MGMVTAKAQYTSRNSPSLNPPRRGPYNWQANVMVNSLSGCEPRLAVKNFTPAVPAPNSTNGPLKAIFDPAPFANPARIKGVRLFHLASILAFIERCEAGAFTPGTRRQTRQNAGPECGRG